MKAARVCGAIALALALQTTMAGFVIGGGTRVDLVLVVVVYVALTSGSVTGLWTGTVGGIAQDALSGGIVGVGGLAKTIVGFLVGVIGSQFIVVPAAALLCCVLCRQHRPRGLLSWAVRDVGLRRRGLHLHGRAGGGAGECRARRGGFTARRAGARRARATQDQALERGAARARRLELSVVEDHGSRTVR